MSDPVDAPCSCPGPGQCPRFGIAQPQYPWEVCQGRHGGEKARAYRRKWAGKRTGTATRAVAPPAPAPAAPARPPLPSGHPAPVRFPLKVVCRHLGPKVKPGCTCVERTCLAGRGVVRMAVECQTCPDHEPR